MTTTEIKQDLKNALLVSAGMIIVGGKKVKEIGKQLESSGFNKTEAESIAREVLSTVKKRKEEITARVSNEIEKHTNFATKEDINSLKKLVNDLTKKLDERNSKSNRKSAT